MNNKHYMLLATIVLALSSSCCSSCAEESFPLIKKENQQAIINSFSHSLCVMNINVIGLKRTCYLKCKIDLQRWRDWSF